jgi:chromosome segregation ATPase
MNRHKPKKNQNNSQTDHSNTTNFVQSEMNVPVSANIIEYNMAVVPAQSYELLRQENSQLKQELARAKQDLLTQVSKSDTLVSQCDSLRNDIAQLNATITRNNTEMELLRRENAELKAELDCVNLKLSKLTIENKDLDAKIDIMISENKEIKLDNKKIHARFDRMEQKLMISKLTIAIQDLNSDDKLERNLNQSMGKLMTDLHNQRNSTCHYIYENDDQQLADYKKQVILDKLNEATPQLLSKFDQKYGKGLSQALIKYLKNTIPPTNYQNLIKEDEREGIEDWWTD